MAVTALTVVTALAALTAPVAIAAIPALAAIAAIAIVVAAGAAFQVRAARTALRACHAKDRECHRMAGEVAHDLAELLTTISAHTEVLIASLDPSGTSVQGAYEIRRVVANASRLAKPLRELGGERPSPDLQPTATQPVASAETRRTAPVLVVEDEPGVRELIKRILVRSGRDVIAVAGPHEALAALNRQPSIALMLVDVVMPEMDGYDLATEARTISPGVHVVFISAFAQDSARHPVGDSFLAKPFTAESLTTVVEDALRDPAA
jgi:CheY-like chemotaxis protein